MRVLAHCYERGYIDGPEGLDQLKAMISERWKGERAIAYGSQLRMVELLEAIHCAFGGLELNR
jgi:glycerol-3-phosphate dehydrogenase